MSESAAKPLGKDSDIPVACVDDPAWVRERYDEARELLSEIRELPGRLPADLWQRVDDFYVVTFMDRCTTFGSDCACNTPGADA